MPPVNPFLCRDLPVQPFVNPYRNARSNTQADVSAFLALQVLGPNNLDYARLVHANFANERIRETPFFRPVARRVMLFLVDACDPLWCNRGKDCGLLKAVLEAQSTAHSWHTSSGL